MDKFEDLARRAEASIDSNPTEAASLYKQALEIRPNWAEGWLYMGAALYQLSRYAEATDAFRKGTALAPGIGTGWAFLGMSEAELDNPDQALADIRKGEELGLGANWQFEVAVRVKGAQILIKASSFDEALLQIRPLSGKDEKSQAVIDTMGLIMLAQPTTLAEVPPQRRAVVSLTGKAAWAFVNQRPADAAEAYKQLIEQYPNEPGVRHAYGLYLMETDLSGALEQFQKEVAANPKYWPALILIGTLQIRQGAPDQAFEPLRQAMKIAPAKYRWLCHAELGRAHLTADKPEAAIAELLTAVRLMPAIAQIHYLLSQAYRRAGKDADADRESEIFQKLKAREDPLGVPSLRPFVSQGRN